MEGSTRKKRADPSCQLLGLNEEEPSSVVLKQPSKSPGADTEIRSNLGLGEVLGKKLFGLVQLGLLVTAQRGGLRSLGRGAWCNRFDFYIIEDGSNEILYGRNEGVFHLENSNSFLMGSIVVVLV